MVEACAITLMGSSPVARRAPWEQRFQVVWCQLVDDVYKRAASADRWKLAGIADEDEALDVRAGIEQRGQLSFGQHRALVDDDGACALLARLAGDPFATPFVLSAYPAPSRGKLSNDADLPVGFGPCERPIHRSAYNRQPR